MTRRFDGPWELSTDDRRLLDALVESGFDATAMEAMSPADRRRAAALSSLFELLEDYPVDDADDALVHATMARIDRAEDERAARLAFQNAVPGSGEAPRRRLRLPDFLSVAAVILIGASVVWPLTTHMRRSAMDESCANNLRRMALAFDQYANDYDGMMPTAQAGLFSSWTPDAENVVNLNPLITNGYCERGHLDCPGHQDLSGPSYSYQWHGPERRAMWGRDTALVLGDRNPVIDAFRDGQMNIPALSMSINHGGRGQNVLARDGATVWLKEPLIGANDNIWLPGGTVVRGTVVIQIRTIQDDTRDVFLAH